MAAYNRILRMVLAVVVLSAIVAAAATATANDHVNPMAVAKVTQTHVTVFQHGARISSSATVALQAGRNRVVIPHVVPYFGVNADTLRIAGVDGVKILQQELDLSYGGLVTNTSELPTIKAALERNAAAQKNVHRLMAATNSKKQAVERLVEQYLAKKDSNESLVARLDAAAEGSSRVEQLDLQSHELWKQLSELEVERAALEKQRVETEEKAQEPVAIIDVEVQGPASTFVFPVSVIDPNAHWSPVYEIDADLDGRTLDVTYTAKVHQSTKRQWSNVPITLCTGDPSEQSIAPTLTPIWIANKTWGGLPPGASQRYFSSSNNKFQDHPDGGGRHSKEQSQSQKFGHANNYVSVASDLSAYLSGSMPTSDATHTETLSPPRPHDLDAAITASDGVVASYVLPHTYSVWHDKEVRLSVGRITIPFTAQRIAVPKLSSRVFLVGNANNTSPLTLLPGPSTISMKGIFAGTSTVPLIARNGNGTIDLGLDLSMKVERHLHVGRYGTAGGIFSTGARGVGVSVTLTAFNLRGEAVELLIRDQVPLNERHSDDVKVKVSKPVVTNNDGEVRAHRTVVVKDVGVVISPSTGVVEMTHVVPANDKLKATIRYDVSWPEHIGTPFAIESL